MFSTRSIRKLLAFPRSSGGQGRRQTAQTRRPIRPRLEALEDRLAPAADPTTVVAGNAAVYYYGANSPSITVPVAVNDNLGGTATSGSVTISLVYNGSNTPVVLGTATVGANGFATVSVPSGTLPANLLPGNYQLEENYSGGTSGATTFASGDTIGTLTVNTLPTLAHILNNVHIVTHDTSPFNIAVNVSTPNGSATSGTVDLSLVNGTVTIPLGTATVGPNGIATLTVTGIPLTQLAALPPGSYQLQVNYTGPSGGPFGNTSTITGFDVAATPTTTLVPGNAVSDANGGPTTIPVLVNSTAGPVNSGTVTISLVTPSGTSVIGSAPVTNGAANVPANIPSGLAPGAYSLVETYADSTGTFQGSSAPGTLTVTPLPAGLAALEFAIDAAELVSLGNPGAIGELQLFSQTVLHKPLTAPNELVPEMQALYPQTGPLGLPALGAAMWLAQDLAIENPMS